MNIVPTHTTEHGYKEPPLVEWRAGLKGYQLIHNMHQVEEDTWNHRFTEEILHPPLPKPGAQQHGPWVWATWPSC